MDQIVVNIESDSLTMVMKLFYLEATVKIQSRLKSLRLGGNNSL